MAMRPEPPAALSVDDAHVSDVCLPPAPFGALSSDSGQRSTHTPLRQGHEHASAGAATEVFPTEEEGRSAPTVWPPKEPALRNNGPVEREFASGGVVGISEGRSDASPAAATAASVAPNATNIRKLKRSSSTGGGGGDGSSRIIRREGSAGSMGSAGSCRLAAAAAREVLVPPTPPPLRDRVSTGGGSGGNGTVQNRRKRRSGSQNWGRTATAAESNGGTPGLTGHPPDATATPAVRPSSDYVEREVRAENEEGGGDAGGGQYAAAPPTLAQVGSYSICGVEERWPSEDEGGYEGGGDRGSDGGGKVSGGGGSGGSEGNDGSKPHARYSSSSPSSSSGVGPSTVSGGERKSSSLAAGQGRSGDRGGGNGSGASPGGTGAGDGGSPAEGGSGAGVNGVGGPDANILAVAGRAAGAAAEAAAGRGRGATNGERPVAMKAVPVSQQQQQQQQQQGQQQQVLPLRLVGESQPLSELKLGRSTADVQDYHPPSVLRQTSKYLHEDLALAKRRQNQRAKAKRRRLITFADDHGDALHDTEFQLGLYYSKEGVPTPRRSGGCCTVS
ncbi:unnamed protein product [Pylaiella littoralis]